MRMGAVPGKRRSTSAAARWSAPTSSGVPKRVASPGRARTYPGPRSGSASPRWSTPRLEAPQESGSLGIGERPTHPKVKTPIAVEIRARISMRYHVPA